VRFEDEDNSGLALSSIVSTATMVLVALADRNACFCCSHFSESSEQQVLAQFTLETCATIHQMVLCGADMSQLVVASLEGQRLTVQLQFNARSINIVSEALSEGHTQQVTGACPALSQSIATCSKDGSVCLWDCDTGICSLRRTLRARLTAIQLLDNLNLLVVGSAVGIFRVLYLATGLPVLYRRRISAAPISQIKATCCGQRALVACLVGTTAVILRVLEHGHVSGVQELNLSSPVVSLEVLPTRAKDMNFYLMVSLSSSELVCLLVPKEASDLPLMERRMRIAAPLVSMACTAVSSENSLGHLHGLSVDHCVRSFDLPSDTNSWAMNKGRVARAVEQIELNVSTAGACFALHPSVQSKYSLVSSHSGSIWAIEFRAQGAKEQVHIGDVLRGGVGAVSFDASGRFALAGLADGSVVIFHAKGPTHLAASVALSKLEHGALMMDVDAEDDADEQVLSPSTAGPVAAGDQRNRHTALAASAEQSAALARLSALKKRLVSLLDQNKQAEENEQLPRMDLGINDALIKQLREGGRKRVAQLRQSLQRSCMAKAVEWHRIKNQCWEHMLRPCQAICGIRQHIVVYSYAIPECSKWAQKVQHTKFLLGVEALEWGSTGRRSNKASRIIAASDGDGESKDRKGEEELIGAPEEVQHNSAGLYTEWDLTTLNQRIIANILLVDKVQQKKEEFNKVFARVQKLRSAASDILMDQNQRLKDAVAELECMGLQNNDVLQPIEVRIPASNSVCVWYTKDRRASRFCLCAYAAYKYEDKNVVKM
jgi:WD40 repeat protein